MVNHFASGQGDSDISRVLQGQLAGKERRGKFGLAFSLAGGLKGMLCPGEGCDWSSSQVVSLEGLSGWAGILGIYLSNRRVRSWQNCGVEDTGAQGAVLRRLLKGWRSPSVSGPGLLEMLVGRTGTVGWCEV